MKPKFRLPHHDRNSLLLALPAAISLALFTTPRVEAVVVYWDPSGGGSFGNINNTTTWVAPLDRIWTTSVTGATTRLASFTTTLADDCNWGGPTGSLGGGTVPVGTVNAGTLSFNTIGTPGSVTLSGGTITLKADTSITASSASQTHTISSTLAGAASSLTKLGPGTIILSGSNTYLGSTIISAGTLTLSNTNALANSPLNTTASVVGSASAGLKATVAGLAFGGLSGSQDLAAVFTTTSGGFGAVNSLILNPATAVTTSHTAVIADGAAGMTLTKNGAGTQVLAGANTFSGSTTVNAGTLRLDYSVQDNSKLSNTSSLLLGNGTVELAGGTHTEVVTATTLTGNATITRTSGSAVLAMGAISGSGSVDFSANNIATTTTPNNALGILPFATIAGSNLATNDGSGNIVTFTGYVDINARGPATVPDNVNAIVRIVGDGTSGIIDLAAPTTSIYSLLQSNANFAATIDTATKTFASTGISVGSSAESLNIGVSPGDGTLRSPDAGGILGLTSANASKTLTINAAIIDNTSASAVNTSGAGIVVLAGANTHTGTTTVGDGTLLLSGSLTGSAVSVVGDAVIDQTSSGSIAGSIGITHHSTGVSVLAGANSYSGVTTINTGSINIQHATALGDTTAGTTVASGTSLQIQNGITVGAEALSLIGTGVAGTGALRNISGTNTYGGSVTLAGATLITSDAGTLTLSNPGSLSGTNFPLTVGGSGNTIINTVIDIGNGTLSKAGTGTLTLTGANNFTGGVFVNGGVLNIQNSNALGTTASGVSQSSGASLELQGGITVGNQSLILAGAGISNTGALRNISGDNTLLGAISFGESTRFQSDAGTLTLNVPSGNAIAGIGVIGAAANNAPMTFGGVGNITVADPIASGNTGAGTLTKDGTGTLTLQAANTYTGATVIAAGLLSLQNALALQNSPLDTTTSVAGDATTGLKTNTAAITLGGLTGDKNLADVFTTDTGGYGGVTALTLNPALARSYAGTIADGAPGMTLTKSGVGVQTLTGAHSYTGATAITGGTLKLDGAASIATSPSITLGSGTVLDVSTLTTPLSLGVGQTLRSNATGANGTGTLTIATDKDLALSAGGLVLPSYGGANGSSSTNAPLTATAVTAAELKLNGAPVTVTTTTQLAPGSYVLVAKGGSALVSGTPGALTVNGAGVSGNPSLAVTGDQLVLTVAAAGFTSWQTANNTTTAIGADHDDDGVENGVEYFLAGPNGNSTGFTILPAVVENSGTLSVTWIKGAAYTGTYNTDFFVETSTTLSGPWTSETSPGNVTVSPADVKYTFPAPLTGARFARLKVTGP